MRLPCSAMNSRSSASTASPRGVASGADGWAGAKSPKVSAGAANSGAGTGPGRVGVSGSWAAQSIRSTPPESGRLR